MRDAEIANVRPAEREGSFGTIWRSRELQRTFPKRPIKAQINQGRIMQIGDDERCHIKERLTMKLSGRLLNRHAARLINDYPTRSVTCVWHFIPHGPLQRWLDE